VVQWFLVEGRASVSQQIRCPEEGIVLWHTMLDIEDADDAELTSLLQTMVLLGDAPLDFIAMLSPQHDDLWEQGRQLRTRLPAYLELQRAFVVAHCPLPGVLQPLVTGYAAPTAPRRTCGLPNYVSRSSFTICTNKQFARGAIIISFASKFTAG
jgi:hypothetical protein